MKFTKLLLSLFLLIIFPIILTAQNNGSASPWFFIQLTDPQFGMYSNNNGFEKETQLYEKAIEEINRLKPDFVVITGDLVNNEEDQSQIAEFKRITAKMNTGIPVYLTPGNHDIGQVPDKQSLESYIGNYGYDRFSFKHKNSFFIGFNSGLIKSGIGEQEQKQYNWIEKELIKNKKASHIILFCHFPFFIKTPDDPETYFNIGPEKRTKYLNLFKTNHVDAVFSGHLHNNVSLVFSNIQMVTTSAVGKPLGDAPSGLRIVKVYNDRIEHAYYGLDEVPDKVTFN